MTDSTKYTARLKGKKIVIFGGSSGVGFGVAEASVEHGATVIISSSNQKRVDDAIQRILKQYPSAKDRISGSTCNLNDAATLEQNVIDFLEKTGKIDHIVHTAGDSIPILPLSEITVQGTIQASMVRYYAPLMIGKHAAKYLSPGPFSSITFTTGSITGRPIPDWVVAGGVMCGVEGLMRGFALDLAPIRVNIVAPGAVETEIWSGFSKEQYEHFKTTAAASAPTGRFAQPEDVAEAYVYLMKDPSVTGIIINSNSGLFLK